MTHTVLRGFRLPDRRIDRLTMKMVTAYLAVSGDDNPIHTDLDSARRAGLPERPVPGMLVMAMLGAFVEGWPLSGATCNLAVRFVAPIFVGGELALSGKVAAVGNDANHVVLRLLATQSGKPCVLGEAEVRLRDEVSQAGGG